jgi:hypothetical protein
VPSRWSDLGRILDALVESSPTFLVTLLLLGSEKVTLSFLTTEKNIGRWKLHHFIQSHLHVPAPLIDPAKAGLDLQ